MMSTTTFWYLLLDSATTGQPYEGSKADFVSLPPGSVAAKFRDAVLSKTPNKLARVDTSDLLVYKNNAAFDMRNAKDDDGGNTERQPLDTTQPVDGLGGKVDKLVFVVPSPKISSQISQTPSFPPCQVPFFNIVCDDTQSDEWISFGQELILSTSLKCLYICECYQTIALSITNCTGIHKAIITGTTGTGKLLFLIYLLWQLVKEGKRILFINHPFRICYDGKGGVFKFERSRLPLEIFESFWNDTLWCLFDAKYKNEADLGLLPVGLSTFILSTPPHMI
jgi:hypothetical protein